MPPSSSPALTNRLLATLSPSATAILLPDLEPIALPHKLEVIRPGEPIEWAVFPDSGFISAVCVNNGRQLEVGMIGREGMTPIALVLGADTSPLYHYVQVAGRGHRIAVGALTEALAESAEIGALLRRYVLSYLVQVEETAFVNGACTVEQRLARWILCAHDRSDNDDIRLTHEFLAIMLGVRRTGVTLALHILEGQGMIRATRGLITVRSRTKLIEASNHGYGMAEAEYESLIGAAPAAGHA